VSTSDNTYELLSALLDGELDAQQEQQVREMIANDPEVAEIYSQLQATQNALASLPSLAPPSSLRSKIEHRLSTARSGGFFSRLRNGLGKPMMAPVYLAAASTVLVIALGTFLVLSSSDIDRGGTFADTSSIELEGLSNRDLDDEKKELTEEEMALERAEEPMAADDFAAAPIMELDSEGVRDVSVAASERAARQTSAMPTGAANILRPDRYRAEIIETYYQPGADRAHFVSTDSTEEYMREWGRDRVFNSMAPAGSDENPIIETTDMLPPSMPSFDFFVPGGWDNSPIIVSGDIHISDNGHVLHFQISGPPEARNLIDSFANKLQGQRVEPQIRNGQPVSLLYQFIAMLYPMPATAE